MKTLLKFFEWLGIGLLILLIIAFVLMAINYFLPQGWKLTSEIFVTLAAVVLSLTWTFLPGLRVQFAALASNIKAIVNLVLMAVLAVVMFLFTCSGWSPIEGVVCSMDGAKALALLVFLAAVGNQVTYLLSTPPGDVLDVKAKKEAGVG